MIHVIVVMMHKVVTASLRCKSGKDYEREWRLWIIYITDQSDKVLRKKMLLDISFQIIKSSTEVTDKKEIEKTKNKLKKIIGYLEHVGPKRYLINYQK